MPLDSFCSVYSENMLRENQTLIFFLRIFIFATYTEILQIVWKCFSVKYSSELFSCYLLRNAWSWAAQLYFFRRRIKFTNYIGKFNLLWQRFQISVCGNCQVQMRRVVCLGFFTSYRNVFRSVCDTFPSKSSKFQTGTILLGPFVGIIIA